jgi:protein SCO1/2
VDEAPSPALSPRARVVAIGVLAVVVLISGLATAWIRRGGASPPPSGTVLVTPVAFPDLAIADTAGEARPLRERAQGKLTLVVLGYTSCPDACPLTMSVLTRSLAAQPPEIRDAVRILFVTVDPLRDDATRLRTYLDAFDRAVVGLVPTLDELDTLQRALEVPAAVAEPADADGDYLVGHVTSVYLFDPDGRSTRRFELGTRQSDWDRLLRDALAS